MFLSGGRFFLSLFAILSVSFSVLAMDEGMWTPSQVPSLCDTLKEMGLEISCEDLSDPTKFPLNAVANLTTERDGRIYNRCSASFVSDQGLVITNHHCVASYVNRISGGEFNYAADGFLAETLADEVQAAPDARIAVTKSFVDITNEVMAKLGSIEDPAARYKKLESIKNGFEIACEERVGKDHFCEIADFYEGGKIVEIVKFLIRDVRLVYAPKQQIGAFGDFDDNWRWPRYCGDYGFLRAYVSPDGKSASFSKDNVPYQPEFRLQVAREGLKENDFVMVVGYPGRSSGLSTAAEVENAANWLYPRGVDRSKRLTKAIYASLEGKSEAEVRRLTPIADNATSGLINYYQKEEASADNLVNFGVVAERLQRESEMLRWIRADKERSQKYLGVLNEIKALNGEKFSVQGYSLAVQEFLRASYSSSFLEIASKLSSAKPNSDESSLVAIIDSRLDDWDRDMDRAKFLVQMQLMAELEKSQQPESIQKFFTALEETGMSAEEAYEQSLLTDVEFLRASTSIGAFFGGDAYKRLLNDGSDPLGQLAVGLIAEAKLIAETNSKIEGRMAVLRPVFVEALREFSSKELFPDANSTIRISYGRVQGYEFNGQSYAPFTSLDGMVASSENAANREHPEWFELPEEVAKAYESKYYGPYTLESGELPVDFLSNMQITNGSSGSSTFNAKAELVGLAFDSNLQGLGSDWQFIPELTRTIHTDIRYVLWVMDALDGADRLLLEMGVEPKL